MNLPTEYSAEASNLMRELDALGGLAAVLDAPFVDTLDIEENRALGDSELLRASGLSEFSGLHGIAGEESGVTDTGARGIARFRELGNLDLRFTRFGDSGLRQLSHLRQLRVVRLVGTDVSDFGIEGLRGSLDELKELQLDHTGVADDSISFLSGAIRLSKLRVRGTEVTDAACGVLESISSLVLVDLSGTRCSHHAIAQLRQSRPDLRVVFETIPDLPAILRNSNIPVVSASQHVERHGGKIGMRVVAGQSVIDSLEWTHQRERRMDQEIEAILQIPEFSTLRSIDLELDFLGDRSCKTIARLEQLQSVSLGHSMVSDEGMRELFGLHHLQSLSLMHCWITDQLLAELVKALPNLRSLALSGTMISDEGVSSLTGHSQLEGLGLWNTKVTDSCLEAIRRLPRLKELEVPYTYVTNAGADWLRSVRPDLKVMQGRTSAY
ncbi:MAG: hypothetical protein NT069_09150 [Planctomycetota bacterium]|nr:hypothetical protein [Planctomycetota bacterium]